jgi:beta-N-acetylhexosaminidase
MAKFKVYIVLISILIIIGGIFLFYQTTQNPNKPASEPQVEKSKSKSEEIIKEVEKTTDEKNTDQTIEQKAVTILNKMTLEEKIGQMMVVGFQSPEPDTHIKKMITEYHVGGVIFYDRNMQNPKQVAKLTNNLQDLAQESGEEVPLMVSVDQEGGTIVRMKDKVSPIPSQQELGKKNDENLVYETANKTGTELAAMGINLNFAPVLDLSTTDSRSFGEDPEKATTFGKRTIQGLSDAGVTSALKHFPGNGRSNIDPHVETSSVQANKVDLQNKDIYPFTHIIKDVDNNQFFVMVTHIKYPAYDKENPASVSSVIMQDLLRQQLGYKGIIVTDDLEMGAVSKYFTYENLGAKAVKSGVDVLLVCHTLENQEKVFNGILKEVKNGKISEQKIDESVTRILTYKLTNDFPLHVDVEQANEKVGNNK